MRKFDLNDTFRIHARFSFFYSGASNTPSRVFQDQHGENIKSDVYFKFNSKGEKIQDSIIYIHPALGQLLKIFNYTYEPAVIYAHFRMTNISWTDPFTDFTFKTNDTKYLSVRNAVEVRKRYGTSFGKAEKYFFTYDNGINPLTQQNIVAFYQFGPEFNNNRWLILEAISENLSIIGFNKNNITSLYETDSPQTVASYTYTYDSDDYPVESIIRFSYPSDTSRVEYEYED